MTVPQDLIERVRKATGPDRELDRDIAVACGLGNVSQFGIEYIEEGRCHEIVPPFTAFADAALALAERVLPGIWYVLAKGRMTSAEPLYGCELLFGHDTPLAIAEGHTQALAIVLAVLTALQSSEQSK